MKSPTRTGHQRGMGGRKTEDDGTSAGATHTDTWEQLDKAKKKGLKKQIKSFQKVRKLRRGGKGSNRYL